MLLRSIKIFSVQVIKKLYKELPWWNGNNDRLLLSVYIVNIGSIFIFLANNISIASNSVYLLNLPLLFPTAPPRVVGEFKVVLNQGTQEIRNTRMVQMRYGDYMLVSSNTVGRSASAHAGKNRLNCVAEGWQVKKLNYPSRGVSVSYPIQTAGWTGLQLKGYRLDEDKHQERSALKNKPTKVKFLVKQTQNVEVILISPIPTARWWKSVHKIMYICRELRFSSKKDREVVRQI